MRNLLQEYSVSSQYYAPRGKERLIFLGEQIAYQHLHYNDKLIGIVGDAGSGKSSLIKGMFPGLELSNDDDVMNPRKIMQARNPFEDLTDASTYHIDVRFQMAFVQMHEIVDFVKRVLAQNRRVIIEHFNLLYPALGMNADIIVGIGEEIIVTRPSVFGPLPESIYTIVHQSQKYRKMAHSAEELTMLVLEDEMGVFTDFYYSSDVRCGFLLRFYNEIDLDFNYLADRIHELIAMNLPIAYYDEEHIKVGERVLPCDGARIHVRNTSEIEDFYLVRKFIYDSKTKTYCLVGLIGDVDSDLSNRNTIHFLKRSNND